MSKRILILEPSETLQTLITEKTTEQTDWELTFVANGLRCLWSLCENAPDVVLLNAKTKNPEGMELVRLIKSIDKLKKIPMGMYATSDFPFEQFYAKNSGADMFVHFKENAIAQHIAKLLSLTERSAQVVPVQRDVLKQAITQHLFSLFQNIDSVEKIAQESLNLIAELGESAAASLFFLEENQPTAYYARAKNLTASETTDFLKVCATDFEKTHPDCNVLAIQPRAVATKTTLEQYHTGAVPLSSYESVPLVNAKKEPFGAIFVVREGNFSPAQKDLLSYCAWRIGLILENAISMQRQKVFEKHIRKAFSRFVPEQIIDELVNEAGTTDKVAVGEKRDVAILFSDIRSFTNISERNKPETIVAFLNRYFTIMCTIIKKHGGTIDKFIGDAIMALFGAPVSYEDNTRRAVAAACEMREALATVPLEDLVLPDGMAFNIGIGIHYGDVIVGSIGSNEKTDYSVIGDSVNLASRLEGLTKTYGSMIVVSDSVKNDIKTDDFVFRRLDNVKVKGKAKAVPIYAVDARADEFPPEYRDAYAKGLDLYQQGVWNLAREYFAKAATCVPADKATKLMLSRCEDFIANPPADWDGAITFTTK